MASVSQRKGADGLPVKPPVWRARYRDASGKEHARHFRRKVDAQRWLDEVTASVVTGTYADPKAGKTRFRTYAEQWRQMQSYRASTGALVETALRKRVYPILGDLPLSAVTRDHVQGMVSQLRGSLAPATVEVTYSYVSTIFKAAVASRMLAVSPCVDIKLPKVEQQQVIPITTEAVVRVQDQLPGHLRGLVVVAAGTGMRQGELFGLSLDRIDFLKRTIRVDRQMLGVVDGEPMFGPPKTPSSVRTVPLPIVVADHIAAHVERFGLGVDGLVFTGGRGAPLRRNTFGPPWRAATKAAGMPGLVFHQLRHHYASVLIESGASVKTVQANLGHKSAQETLDTYAHLWPDSDDQTRRAVDEAFRKGGLADSLRTESIAS